MQIDDSDLILALDETRSLSRAAEKLFMSRPGLSQHLANYEKELGHDLYLRTSTGLIPTKAGEIVARYAREVASLKKSMGAELAASEEHLTSNVNVGMSLNDGVYLLPRAAAKFHQAHPDAVFHLDAGYEPMLARKVKNGDLDFALVENYSGDDELEMRTLGYAFLEFCAPNKPPYNSVAQPVAINTLLRWPMLIYEWESGRHMVGNRHFRDRYGISLMDHYIVGEFDTHQAMVEGARNGMGWAAIPHCIAREYKDDPRILWFAVETDIVRYPVSLIRKKDRALSPLAQKFYSYIESDLPENYFAPSEG